MVFFTQPLPWANMCTPYVLLLMTTKCTILMIFYMVGLYIRNQHFIIFYDELSLIVDIWDFEIVGDAFDKQAKFNMPQTPNITSMNIPNIQT